MREWKCKNISGQDFSCEGPWTDLDGLKSNFSLHDASCLGSVMVPLRLHPCNWHIQLSLTYSAFCARKAIEHFGSTSVLTSSSYWNCIFSVTEICIRNVKSKVVNWWCSCNTITSFAIYIHSSVVTWCVLMVPDDTPVSWSDDQGSWGIQVIRKQFARIVHIATAWLLFASEGLRRELWSEQAALQAGSRMWIH